MFKKMKIGKKIVSENSKTYFVADIAANHDGSLKRAKKLIKLCAKAGADAAKFQHFKASTIISKDGFNDIGKLSHQSKWKKSVYQIYEDASINFSWTKELKKECKKNNIDFLTSPYDLNYVDEVNKYICAYKIGSGDITWLDIIKKIAKKRKPVILATGASQLDEVKRAVKEILKYNKNLVLMQCNTNYSNSEKNFKYINLNALKSFKKIFGKKIILGLSDHTPGHATVLGSVALGVRVVEKHFTDDNNRNGPDHKFSMNFQTWKTMVDETRRLEFSMGNGVKKIEFNEKDTNHIQRRSYYSNKNITKGERIKKNFLIPLRPYLKNSFSPDKDFLLINKIAKKEIKKGKCIKKNMIR